MRIPGERFGELVCEPGLLAFPPKVVRATGDQRFRVHGRVLDPRLAVSLDLLEQGIAAGLQLEGVHPVGVIDGHHDSVGLANNAGHLTSGTCDLSAQPLRPQRVDRLPLQLSGNILPAEQAPNSRPRRVQPLAGGYRRHERVSVDPGSVRTRRVIEKRPGGAAGLA